MVGRNIFSKRDQKNNVHRKKHENKTPEMYEEIVDEFNKETLSKSTNLVALSKDICSIEKVINIKRLSKCR